MPELEFIETDSEKIKTTILTELENGINEQLYPGDERRIFGEALASVIVSAFNSINDACRQKMLRYARGETLDALGQSRDVYRIGAEKATATLVFSVKTAYSTNIIIPEGTRVTGDLQRYFLTTKSAVLNAGELSVEVEAEAENSGTEYNGIFPGGLNTIVDISNVPLIDSVSNRFSTSGGADPESDEAFRERIRVSENKLSTAGTEKAYKYFAISANASVTDAAVFSDEKGVVKIVPVCAGGEIPSQEILDEVYKACSADDVRPLTDKVVVEAPQTELYDIELTYYTTKNDESQVIKNIEGESGAINRYIEWQGNYLEQDINPDYLRKLILSPDWSEGLTGATRVDITKPEYKQLGKTTIAKFSGNISVNHVAR